jgi:hypothetical protein
MTAISDSVATEGLNEKGQHDIHRSSSDRSYVAGNEKSSLPVESHETDRADDTSSDAVEEVFDVKQIDPVLARKMALVNSAIDEMGMTSFQWKLLFLNGFGYAVDSVWKSSIALASRQC